MKPLLLTALFSVLAPFCFSQAYFNMVRDFPATQCEPYCNPNPDFTQIKRYNDTAITKAFHYISKQSNAQFNYPQGGCPERALIMRYLLDSMQLSNFRIWLFAPSRLVANDTNKIFILDKNNLTTDSRNRIEWDFHVAPCVLRNGANGKVDTLVIDPSLNGDKPLKHTEWMAAIGNSNMAGYTFLDGKYYQFNRQNNGTSNVINGYFYPYEGFAFDNLWLERMLALNDVAYAIFNKYIKGKDQNDQQVKDIKAVIGNSATLKEVLDYKDGKPAPARIRNLVITHPDFIKNAWSLYSSQLVYWAQRIQHLRR